VPVAAGPSAALTPEQKKAIAEHDTFLETLKKGGTAPTPGATPGAASEFDPREYKVVDLAEAVSVEGKNTGLWGVIVAAVIGGIISLATPCVFPMIPIT